MEIIEIETKQNRTIQSETKYNVFAPSSLLLEHLTTIWGTRITSNAFETITN